MLSGDGNIYSFSNLYLYKKYDEIISVCKEKL